MRRRETSAQVGRPAGDAAWGSARPDKEQVSASLGHGWAVGGAVGRVDMDATSVGERERKVGFEINVTAAWPPRDQAGDAHIAWAREGWDRLRPHASGVYANFLSDEGESGVKEAFGERLERLRALKDRYDPSNVFRLNANIRPSRDGTHGEEG